MRLLWVWVVVGVVGGAKGEGEEFRSQKEAAQLMVTNLLAKMECVGSREVCRDAFVFAVTSLQEVRKDGVLEVLLSLEESLHPHVTFDLSLRSERWQLGALDEETILAREEVTLEVNELRRVVLRVSDLQWKTADLVVAGHPTGQPEIETRPSSYTKITKVTSEVEVFVQTDKKEYVPGDTVNYRAVVVDGNVDKTPKFAQVILITDSEIRLPWAEVPKSGIVSGNFTYEGQSDVRVRVTSNVTSSDSSVEASLPLSLSEPEFLKLLFPVTKIMSVALEGLSDVYFSQPRVKGRVTLTSSEGLPLEGNCNVTIRRGDERGQRLLGNDLGARSEAVELPAGEFEFDLVEEMGAEWEGAGERMSMLIKAKCSHALSGIVEDVTQSINIYRSLFNVELLSVGGPLQTGNSSHPERVVLRFLVERRDGRSVEEEEPSKGLHVELLLSEENLERLRPSATNFSLLIPKDGEVRLEFEVSALPPSSWNDSVRLEVGDAVKVQSLEETKPCGSPTLELSMVNKSQVIRRGDVVQFRVRSCATFRSLNAVLFSSKAIYSSHRSFSSEEEGRRLDEVFELRVPQNVTEGSLNLTIYGMRTKQGIAAIRDDYSADSATVQLNVEPPQIKIIDQVDGDLSTSVTFLLEGILADSIVTLQAAKLPSTEEIKHREFLKKPEDAGPQIVADNQKISAWDNSPGGMEKEYAHIASNFKIKTERFYDAPSPLLLFLVVDRMNSTDDNGTFEVTKTFDRLTQPGTYVVSGATFTAKFGRTLFSNFPTITILPPPVTLSISVPQSVILGETFEVISYVKNNFATPFEGQVTLDWSEGGSTEKIEHQGKVKPNSFGILKLKVTPRIVGDIFLSLRTNISSGLTATQKVRVNPVGEVLKFARHFIISDRRGSPNGTLGLRPTHFELPFNCTPSSEATQVVFQGDILGDISSFVNENEFQIACGIPCKSLSYAKVLLSTATFYSTKKDDTALQKTLGHLQQLQRLSMFRDDFLNHYSVSGIASEMQVAATNFPGEEILRIELKGFSLKLKLMQQADGSIKERAATVDSVRDVGVIVDTALALSVVIKANQTNGLNLDFNVSDFTRGVELLRRMTVGGQVKDNFPLSLVTFLFSQLDDRDTSTFFKMLESTASNDSNGIFWASKWNGETWTDSLASSVTATSYALMTYVNMKKLEKADEIARWLVSKKNVNGFYASFEETAVAVESLSKYATFYASVRKVWPSLVKLTQECVTPRKNVSTADGFSIQAASDKDGGTLHLKICSKKENLGRLRFMQVSLPSGFKSCNHEIFPGLPFFYLRSTECKHMKYCRMHEVSGKNPQANGITTGSVTYYDFFDPLTRSVALFEAIKNEGDLKSLQGEDKKHVNWIEKLTSLLL